MHTTSMSLLERLRRMDDGEVQSLDEDAWQQFVGLYTPLLLSWARKVCFQEQDAVDLLQDVFSVLVRKLPSFVYQRGKSFRSWLRTVTLNKWRERCRTNKAPITIDSTSRFESIVDESQAEAFWETEFRQNLVNQAFAIMQADFAPQTWKACWELVANEKSAPQVAAELGMTIGSVYAAKVRVMARLREELRDLLD